MTSTSDIAGLICSLVRIPSVTHDHERCYEIIEFCQDFLGNLEGVTFETFDCAGHRSLIVSYGNDEPNTFDIILNAHLDVVDAEEEMFTPKTDGDVIRGRGAFDMKSTAAAQMIAFMHHVRKKSPLSVGLVLTTDEEIGGFNGVKFLVEQKGLTAQCAVVPDGGGPDFGLIVSQKGGLWLEVLTEGKSAHASTPEEGINAIMSFMDDYHRLEKELRKIPDSTISLSSIAGSGPALNAVPDVCEAKLDIRSAEPNKALAAAETMFTGAVRIINRVSPYKVIEDDPFTTLFIESLEEASGAKVIRIQEKGGSDARHFAEVGIPTLVCSIEGGGLHGKTEWVSVNSATMLADAMGTFLAKAEMHLLKKQMH